VQYVVGTPKGRLTRLEQELLVKPWQQARPAAAKDHRRAAAIASASVVKTFGGPVEQYQ
jgi:hypothetical protein